MTELQAFNFLLNRGYEFDLQTGQILSPYGLDMWSNDEEEAAVRQLTKVSADGQDSAS